MITDTRTYGLDFGGTQASLMTRPDGEVISLPTATFNSMDDAIYYIVEHFGKPDVLRIGAAGPVGEDGSIKLTNRPDWPVFYPKEIGETLGIEIIIVNDMVIKAFGIRIAVTQTLKPGESGPDATKVVVTISSGAGNAQLMPNGTVISSEGGHTTWQPANKREDRVLRRLRKQLGTRYFSIEELIAGKHADKLYRALTGWRYHLRFADRRHVKACLRDGIDIGPFLTGKALEGDRFCEQFMEILGSLLGQYLRNLAVFTLPTGGIYLTGGVMQPEVVRYLFEKTSLLEAFLGGSTHNDWLARIPILLVTDKNLGVKGAAQ